MSLASEQRRVFKLQVLYLESRVLVSHLYNLFSLFCLVLGWGSEHACHGDHVGVRRQPWAMSLTQACDYKTMQILGQSPAKL